MDQNCELASLSTINNETGTRTIDNQNNYLPKPTCPAMLHGQIETALEFPEATVVFPPSRNPSATICLIVIIFGWTQPSSGAKGTIQDQTLPFLQGIIASKCI